MKRIRHRCFLRWGITTYPRRTRSCSDECIDCEDLKDCVGKKKSCREKATIITRFYEIMDVQSVMKSKRKGNL